MTRNSFTTSDQIKSILSVTLDTESDDWKRTSKNKNAEGQWVREFNNGVTGETVSVTENKGGGFGIVAANGESFSIDMTLADMSAPKGDPKPVLETDPAKNAAADKVIAYMIGDEDEPEYQVKDQLVDAAGRALANRYNFAVSESEGMIYTMMVPAKFFERTGAASEATGPLSHLMPKASELSEATWEISGVKDVAEAAKYLQGQGFTWSRNFQDIIDSTQTPAIASALKSAAKAAAKAQPSPKP